MKTICASGSIISTVDQLALDNYLVITCDQWGQEALSGMINKAIKLIMNKWYKVYESTQTGSISGNYSVLIPAIMALPNFEMTKIITPFSLPIDRTLLPATDIWVGGFQVEDYEDAALKAVYENVDDYLINNFQNKIYHRRNAFCNEYKPRCIQNNETYPVDEDDFIVYITNQAGYQNRRQREAI